MSGKSGKRILLAVGAALLVPAMFGSLLVWVALAGSCAPGASASGQPGQAGVAAVDNSDYKPPEHADDPVSESVAGFLEKIALDDSHGYSQPRRLGDPDYDCSSSVWFAVKAAGYDTALQGWPFTTFTMGPILEGLGFAHLTWSGDYRSARTELKRGDIVVNPAAHTEVYLGGGLFGGARHATPGGIDDGMPGDQGHGTDQEIGISPYLDVGLNQVYRHDPSSKPTAGAIEASTDGAAAPTACQTPGPSSEEAGGGPTPDGTNASPEQAKQIARQMIGRHFPTEDADQQFGCLDPMWTRESGWRWDAENTGSGAYGIPQSLPGSKMAAAGPDWRTNASTQITWGLDYIRTRYHTPCEAWSIWQTRGWY